MYGQICNMYCIFWSAELIKEKRLLEGAVFLNLSLKRVLR